MRLIGQIFLDRPGDTPVDAGRDWVLGEVNRSIENCKRCGASTLLFRDWPRGPRYTGAPDLSSQLDPAWHVFAKEMFARVTDAGLRLGMTVRPDPLRLVNGTWQHVPLDAHNPTGDAELHLRTRVTHAVQEYNATYFYADAPVIHVGGIDLLLPATCFDGALNADPRIEIVPEYHSAEHWRHSTRLLPMWETHKAEPPDDAPSRSIVNLVNCTESDVDRIEAWHKRGMSVWMDAWATSELGLKVVERLNRMDPIDEQMAELGKAIKDRILALGVLAQADEQDKETGAALTGQIDKLTALLGGIGKKPVDDDSVRGTDAA